MYIKTKNGDYVNSKNISALRIKHRGGDFNVVADCINYCGGHCFYTSAKREDAQAYMTLMANRLSEEEKAETIKFPRCAILTVSESAVDAMRYSYRPLQSEPMPTQGTKLSAVLATLVDDFAASGDTDNLLKINAYIRMHLQQEANHE